MSPNLTGIIVAFLILSALFFMIERVFGNSRGRVFGTFYMPRDRMPQNFGINDPMPNHLVGQLMRPFRAGR